MKRALIISYFFPPDGGAGTQRAAKFCKYLPEHGWEATVVTRDPAATRDRMVPADAALSATSGETRVVRVAEEPRLSPWAAALPRIDVGYTWLEPALAAAKAQIASWGPDVVLITMSPFSLAFLGWSLQQEAGVPVVYDLRDPWALDGWRLHGTRRRWRRIGGHEGHAQGRRWRHCQHARCGQAIAKAVPSCRRGLLHYQWLRCGGLCLAGPAAPTRAKPHISGSCTLVHCSRTVCMSMRAARMAQAAEALPSEPIDTSGRTPFHLLRAIAILRPRSSVRESRPRAARRRR